MEKKAVTPLDRFKNQFLKKYFVRFHMSLILAGTIGAGVLTSRALLGFGLDRVMLRYGLDLIAAYAMFLLLVRIWIWYVKPGQKLSLDADLLDGEDLLDVVTSPGEMV